MNVEKFSIKKIFIFSFILLVIVFLLLEFASFLYVSEQKKKLKEEYLPLIARSKISKEELINHQQNIRNAISDYGDIREYHPELIYIYRPNLNYQTFKTNKYGFMNTTIDNDLDKILLVGSSVINGGLRVDKVENINAHLQKILTSQKRLNIQAINAGIGGYTSFQERNLVEIYYDKIKPKYIVYMSGANDIDSKYRLTRKLYDKEIRFYDNLHSYILRKQIDNLLKLKSSPYSSLKNYIPYFLKSLNLYKLYVIVMSESYNDKVLEKKEDLSDSDKIIIKKIVYEYISNVEKMAKLIEERDETKAFLVGVQPNIFTKRIKTKNEKIALKKIITDFKYNYQNYFILAQKLMYLELKKIESKYPKLKIINTHNIFDNQKKDVFRDAVHFFDYSNKVIAEEISKEIN